MTKEAPLVLVYVLPLEAGQESDCAEVVPSAEAKRVTTNAEEEYMFQTLI